MGPIIFMNPLFLLIDTWRAWLTVSNYKCFRFSASRESNGATKAGPADAMASGRAAGHATHATEAALARACQ